ncbi:hypothetical protein INR49_004159 [Caranx melampygus]|nr:hypothetical protein INR49_004159 [Caranx melampygus]
MSRVTKFIRAHTEAISSFPSRASEAKCVDHAGRGSAVRSQRGNVVKLRLHEERLRNVSFFKMVMLDVLLIGSGPQALTLASLLTNQEPGDPDLGHDSSPSPSCLDPLRTETNSSNRRRCSDKKKKKKKKGTTAGATVEQKPATPEKVVLPPLSLRVVDSYGEWAALWASQFTALNIPHLRSHALVHTDPLNKKALQDFVLTCDRSAELHSLPDQVYILDENAFFNDMRLGKKEKKRLNVTSTLKKSLSFSLPGTRLSVDFFRDQVQRYDLDKLLIKGTVEKIVPITEHREEEEEERDEEWEMEGEARRSTESRGDGVKKEKRKRVKYFQVHLQQDGIVLKARRVVVATGPTRAQMANVPSWVRSIGESFPEERLQHTVQLMHHLTKSKQEVRDAETSPDPGQRVMVVGGGLTSAHVVSIALQQGASHVTWVMRKHLQLKQFDVGDVESLVGRYSHVEHGIKMDGRAYLRQFYNERSLHKRLAMIRQARKGGAVTPRPTSTCSHS